VVEDDKVFIYHNLDNSQMLHTAELQCVEVEPPVSCSLVFDFVESAECTPLFCCLSDACHLLA